MTLPATREAVFSAEGDDALFRKQIAPLFANSAFYREKLAAAGFDIAQTVGGIADIAALPFTEKDELRQTGDETYPIGTRLAAPMSEIARVFSTSGTAGTPSYIPLTAEDLDDWVIVSTRSFGATGVREGDRIVSAYSGWPFVAGVALEAFVRLGLCDIPVGTGNTERLMAAVKLLKPSTLALTPSYALHLAEWGEARGMDLPGSSVQRILVAGEPGGGEPELRVQLEAAWGAKVTEAMGIGDIGVSVWGECEAQRGMHFSGSGYVHFELIDSESDAVVPLEEGAEGEMVYTHLRQHAAPLLRFRSRDHVRVSMGVWRPLK